MADSDKQKNYTDKKTTLNDRELKYFKDLITKKRKNATDELETLRISLEDITDSEADDASSTTHHMGDVGSEVEDEEMKYTLIERTKKYIDRLDEALERIENKTYGICQATGNPISKGRLEAVPHTRFSIDAKKQGLAEDK